MSIDDRWQELLDKDDRTSPAEYPGMVLVTRDELEAALILEREDAALLAFAVVMKTLTAASRERAGTVAGALVGDALLEVSLAFGKIGKRVARMLATGSKVLEA